MTLKPRTSGRLAAYPGFRARRISGAWRRYRCNGLALFGALFVFMLTVVAALAPQLAPYPYDAIDPDAALQGPSARHPIGTDVLGRDLLSRLIFGARPMLLVGLLTQTAGVLIGVPLGLIAGYAGGWLDWLITSLIDMFSALPWILVVLYLMLVFSPGLPNLILALTLTSWVLPCRLVRATTLTTRAQSYVLAARALGIPSLRVVTHHVLPQSAPLALWAFAVGIPGAVFAEAGLSFIGMGVRPPQPSWGQMLVEAGTYWQYAPHLFLFPSLMITLTVVAFQGIADGLRAALAVNVHV